MHTVKEADMLAAKIDLLLKKFDERTTNANTGTINVLDSQMTCEVCGNVGHSGNDCLETCEDATYINNGNDSCLMDYELSPTGKSDNPSFRYVCH
jgi:hypothetical protein